MLLEEGARALGLPVDQLAGDLLTPGHTDGDDRRPGDLAAPAALARPAD